MQQIKIFAIHRCSAGTLKRLQHAGDRLKIESCQELVFKGLESQL